ncbi:MAG: T9SS type A sorting domain-containing protein [Bacteroidota bacterium]
MQKSYWPFLLFLLLPHLAVAQTGTCEPALAEAYLDAGNVRARILNNGGLFWRGSPHVYEIDGANAIFASGIWISGLIDNTIHAAASLYGPWEFWSGPLDTAGNPPTDCKLYDQIWEIRREDIQSFINEARVSSNLNNWPWQLGAPVIDGDGNPNNYNIEGGDLPELLGDQRLWWIMNDRGNTHDRTGSPPLGIEVHASAFAYTNPATLGNITFYEYKIINKNTSPITETHVGLFSDIYLGYFIDDFVGSDSLLHLAYAYNADNVDERYGDAPPAIGFTFLETILAENDGLDNNRDGIVDEIGEKLGTHAVMYLAGGGGVNGDPITSEHFHNYMQAIWKDGRHLIEGLAGRRGISPFKRTRFYWSGDPVTGAFWSEKNLDNQGNPNNSFDRALVTSTGPFTLASADTATIRFAIIWSRGEDNLDSITVLRKDTQAVRSASESLYSPPTREDFITIPQPSNYLLGFDQNFPNPFSLSTTLRYSLPQPMQVRLAVYDLLGREVALLVDAQQEAGIHTAEFDAGSLPAGMYLARIELDFLQFTKRMVITR